jgi:hypothetical protein
MELHALHTPRSVVAGTTKPRSQWLVYRVEVRRATSTAKFEELDPVIALVDGVSFASKFPRPISAGFHWHTAVKVDDPLA